LSRRDEREQMRILKNLLDLKRKNKIIEVFLKKSSLIGSATPKCIAYRVKAFNWREK